MGGSAKFASRPGKTPTAAAKNAFNSIRATRPATPFFARRASSSARAGTESLRIPDGGRLLDAGERNQFEPRFGFSFANVRVHDGAEAANAAKAVGARAFTLGNHIVFGAGAQLWRTSSRTSFSTVASPRTGHRQSAPRPMHGEREAEAIAAKVHTAERGPLPIRARISPSVLYRQSVHMASGRFVGDMEGTENNKREEVLSVLDKLGELGAISQPDYGAEYKHVSALPASTPVDLKAVHATILSIKAAEEPSLDVATAKKELNLKLWNDVGKGRQNNKVDGLAVQDQLNADGHLTDTDYNARR